MNITTSHNRLRAAVVIAFVLLPMLAGAWSGEPWAPITRAQIKAIADQMIDSTWVPKNTFSNWQYTSSSSGNGVYQTYNAGTTYKGVAYSQSNPQDTWAEFQSFVSNTAGGSQKYGNDCSGFASICWKLPARKTTYYFEAQLGTYWTSLGNIGSAASAPLIMGDALNSSSVGHIVLFLKYESTGVRTMEQTPNNAQRKLRSFSNLAGYRPIRRLQIVDGPTLITDGLSKVADVGNPVSFSVGAEGSAPLKYRWYFNGSLLSTATTNRLNLVAHPSVAGQYVCTVSNAQGAVTSRVMSLTVYPRQTTVFFDDFDTNSSARWILSRSSLDTRATFASDYSSYGIPSAPRSTPATTKGLRFEANMTAGATAAISLSPLGRSFAGDHRLRFDLWINANGPFPEGGTGSTQHATAGIGTAGNSTHWTGATSTADGFWFAVDGEGQAGDTSSTVGDFCAYAGGSLKASGSGVYEAGSATTAKANVNPYYVTAFPLGNSAPAVQQAAYQRQTGACAPGTIGFGWREVIVSRRGNTVDWSIDGIRIATITNASLTASNVFIGYWDMFSSLSDNANLSFAIIDNVRVEVPVVAPAIAGDPQNRSVLQGTPVEFTVAATGVPSPSYQWHFNNAPLEGATKSSYAITNTILAHCGSYKVAAFNEGGAVTSSVATLEVRLPQPAHFDSLSPSPNGSFTLNISGEANATYVIEWTSDFLHWSNLCTISSPDGVFQFKDNQATNDLSRFYRVRPQ